MNRFALIAAIIFADTALAKADEPAKPAASATAGKYGSLKLVKDGFKKLDTPTWLPEEKFLIASDVEAAKLFKATEGGEVSELREGRRGKVGPDGRYYGHLDGKLVVWKQGEKPEVILESASGGKELSMNDLVVVGNGFLYFTTLLDPKKGRLTAVDLAKKTATVVYDGAERGDLSNPNGIAVSVDGKHIYLGVSTYNDKKNAGIYRFPLKSDGSIDLPAGKVKKWANVSGSPDGFAIGPDGYLYATNGSVIVVIDADGNKVGELKIPKASGKNLCFGGVDGKTLYVTTNAALYSAVLDK